MGDRVILVCKDEYDEYSPGVYLHNGGHDALEIVKEAAPFMRANDVYASAAGLCGYCFKLLGDVTANNGSICIFNAPEKNEKGKIDWEEYSHGDAGVVIINVTTGLVECITGYLHGKTIDEDIFFNA